MIYFVATPIGNLKDITFRAIETLEKVDLIACEDTRHSIKLLNHYNIKKPLKSFHKFNEKVCGEKLISEAMSGKEIAVISDAGTPLISDPGSVLVQMLKEKNIEFTVIPGANAFVPALILSGIATDKFSFIGFLPEKNKDREKLLECYKEIESSLIIYSAPQDVEKDILTLYKAFGERKAAAVREITKIHEEAVNFNLSEGLGGDKRGEYVLIVEGGKKEMPEMTEKEHINYYIDKGFDKKEALKLAARDRGISKSDLYKYTIEK
jgi:16S rRNA (cytidine1402-2'-O)-methyltransferase